jgi:hypothetical protein
MIGTFWRVRRMATGPSVSKVLRQAIEVSLASAGRITVRFGITRRAMKCSTGWWVGPSSPKPTESWVKIQATGMFIKAESLIAGRM